MKYQGVNEFIQRSIPYQAYEKTFDSLLPEDFDQDEKTRKQAKRASITKIVVYASILAVILIVMIWG